MAGYQVFYFVAKRYVDFIELPAWHTGHQNRNWCRGSNRMIPKANDFGNWEACFSSNTSSSWVLSNYFDPKGGSATWMLKGIPTQSQYE